MILRRHPLLYSLVRAAVARRLAAAGRSPDEIDAAFRAAGATAVDAAFHAAGETVPPAHPILEAVLAWLRSPEGEAVVAALVKILLAVLGL
jgi:hypothetical protein